MPINKKNTFGHMKPKEKYKIDHYFEIIYPNHDDRRGITLLWQDWKNQRGFPLLEAIALDRISPEEAGKEWFDNEGMTYNAW